MKIKYDDVFVCSIKTTCNKDNEPIKDKEIIEFGGCFLNVKSLQMKDPFNVVVKPKGEISAYCTSKTGLTPEDVSSGVTFLELIEFVEEFYEPKRRAWASYGTFADHVVRSQCLSEGIAFPFSDRFFNIKSLMPMMFNLNYEVSLNRSIETVGLNIPKGKDSQDDAMNASILFKEILRGPMALGGNFVTCQSKRRKSKRQ